MKDNFSADSGNYAKYRPDYPTEFFGYLRTIITGSEHAWDCGTGNGQAAERLAHMFTNVHATDISAAQLQHAAQQPNISYSVQPAEKTNFPPDFFDLVMVAQAIHWFDFEKFYSEVNRTAKSNALLVVIGYGRLKISNEIDPIIDRLYSTILGSYWDKERRYIDEDYRTIPFPFTELSTPQFRNTCEWTLEHVTGYLETWSAVKHYRKEKGSNPIDFICNDLKNAWGQTEARTVSFPLLLRIGKIKS
jgi:SAM-dependent methyltransferase